MSKVTVITATVGNPRLRDNLASVSAQDHEDVEHLVIVDGPERYEDVEYEIEKAGDLRSLNLVKLPYPVGTNGWNGHRMYAAGPFLANGDFVMWLDDDNTLEPDHISSLLSVIKEKKLDWAYSFRNIVDKNGEFLCQDNCESLGKWASVMHEKDFFIDVNCYFVPTKIAIHLGPAWYRRFRQPGQPEVDRVLSATLMQNGLKFDTTYRYTVNYTVGNTKNSVQKEFFDRGNKEMLRRHPDGLPWKVMELPL
jgi:glycosyltransferase involved in cell wall biosynthesis